MAGNERALKALTLVHRTPQEALRALSLLDLEFVADESWNRSLVERLQAVAAGARDDFRDVRIEVYPDSAFARRVICHCRRIAHGRTLTYGELAARAGSPRAARAVGNIMAVNRTPLVVPCHRVVARAGHIGYSTGERLRGKLRLLEQEQLASPWDGTCGTGRQ